MCGFFGVIGENIEDKYSHLALSCLNHRGPDYSKIYQEDNVCLGHTRLMINDLSSHSNQPFIDENYVLIYNGEIYNFKDLQKYCKEIKNKDSDTETLFKLLSIYGDDCLHMLNGMFSFGLWNRKTKTFIAARDRNGEKPFYYSLLPNGSFIFGSEIKALLATNKVKTDINSNQLLNYFLNMHVDPGSSIYQNVKSLQPGEMISYKNYEIKIKKYYKFSYSKIDTNYSEAKNHCNFLIDESIKRQISANEEVGVLLSGGIDSTTIVAKASKINSKLKTFSFGFQEKSELDYAKKISKFYNTEHYELYDNKIKVSDLLYKMQNIYDEPFSDSSCIPTYLITQFASEQLKVVLGGDGADEYFYGYSNWYNRLNDFDKFMSKRNIRNLISLIPNFLPIFRSKKNFLNIVKNSSSYVDVFRMIKSPFHINHILKLGFTTNKESKKGEFEYSIDEVLDDCIEHYLPGNILVKSDRASMANSLELRAPFLDHNLTEYVRNLPIDYNLKNSNTKIILRDILRDEGAPPEIVNRKKQGFGAPIKSWLQRSDILEIKNDLLFNKNSKIFDYLNYNEVIKDLNKGNYREWSYLNLAIWFETRRF